MSLNEILADLSARTRVVYAESSHSYDVVTQTWEQVGPTADARAKAHADEAIRKAVEKYTK